MRPRRKARRFGDVLRVIRGQVQRGQREHLDIRVRDLANQTLREPQRAGLGAADTAVDKQYFFHLCLLLWKLPAAFAAEGEIILHRCAAVRAEMRFGRGGISRGGRAAEPLVQRVGFLVGDIEGGIAVFAGGVFKVVDGVENPDDNEQNAEQRENDTDLVGPACMDAARIVQKIPKITLNTEPKPPIMDGPRPGLMLFICSTCLFLIIAQRWGKGKTKRALIGRAVVYGGERVTPRCA